MPNLHRVPFPSIHHILEAGPDTDEPMLPRRPSVITIVDMAYDEGRDYAASWTPTGTLVSSSSHSLALASTSISMSDERPSSGSDHRDLMKTIDLRDAEPIARNGEEQFSFIVHFHEDEEADNDIDNDDARTVFEQNRPSTSRGLAKLGSNGSSSDVKAQNQHISVLLVTAVRKLQFLGPVKMKMKAKMPSIFTRKIVQH
ncbi:hypothetical protein CPB84DRAFT_928399 [Gymnopilus junonius]|uniref:Uncharacterized protein n=1 Tax=Gymnopilus junonius TaxID=109634 RepID=A0A9P5NX44_GYMJU|nr:hypothetical protein CPB84DRAFT_928399 [Gymnopilus junonius]